MVMFDKDDIIDLRAALRMTAAEFGARLGVTGNTVFRWESGERFPSRRHTAILNQLLQEVKDRKSLQSA